MQTHPDIQRPMGKLLKFYIFFNFTVAHCRILILWPVEYSRISCAQSLRQTSTFGLESAIQAFHGVQVSILGECKGTIRMNLIEITNVWQFGKYTLIVGIRKELSNMLVSATDSTRKLTSNRLRWQCCPDGREQLLEDPMSAPRRTSRRTQSCVNVYDHTPPLYLSTKFTTL